MVASRLSTRVALMFLLVGVLASNFREAFQKQGKSHTESGFQEFLSTLKAPSMSSENIRQQQQVQEDNSLAMVPIQKLIDATIEKWSLPDTDNVKLLVKRIWEKDFPYNPKTDLIVFYHPLKSGGTSVSTVLDQVGKVVPGSHASGHFDFKKCSQQQANFTGNSQQWWEQFKVLYSHDEYRHYSYQHTRAQHYTLNTSGSADMTTQQSPPKPTKLYRFLQNSGKRIRHLSMVREPIAYVASNMNEWICKNAKWQRKAKQQNIAPATNQTHACYGYTLQQLTEVRRASNIQECHNLTREQLNAKPKFRRRICRDYQALGKVDDTPHCASTSAFLEQYPYRKYILSAMGYYYEPPSIMQQNGIPRKEEVMEGVMEFLGGIDVTGIDDILWFGITERMQESLCLLHYRLGIPWREMPQKRVQSCRPTTYWDEDSKNDFYERESFMMELHRAANAVLDIQLARMKHDIQLKVGIRDDNITATTSYPFVPAKCYTIDMDGSSM